MSNTELKRLGDVINLKRGYDLPAHSRTKGKYPVISSSGISGYHNQYKIDGKGVIIGRYGTLGDAYYIDGKYWPHNTTLYVQDFKGNDERYIYSLMKLLGRINTSDKSAVPGVNRNELHEMSIPVVTEKIQQVRIGELLSSFDESIAVRREINSQLEQSAQLIYDYWFNQFDFPDENGKPYKSSGGKMVYSPELKREIPACWEVAKLADVCRTYLGGTPSRSKNEFWENGSIPWLSSGEVAEFPIIKSSESITPEGLTHSAAKLLSAGSIMISITGNIRVSVLGIDACANQSVVGVENNNRLNTMYLYFSLSQNIPKFESQMTGAVQKHINKDVVDETNLLVPSREVLEAFNEKTQPMLSSIVINRKESEMLAELRDWLLPLLMIGQVKVSGDE